METDNNEELNLLNEAQGDIRRDNTVFLLMAFFFCVIGLDLLPGLHTYIEHLAIPVWAYAGLGTLCFLGVIHGSVIFEKNRELIFGRHELSRQEKYRKEYLERSNRRDEDHSRSSDRSPSTKRLSRP